MPALNALLSRLFLSLCLLALAACSSTGGGVREVRAGTDALPPPDTTDAAGAYQGTSEYRLGANDQVEISVFGVQDLTKTVRINTNGQISLPLIGAVPAGGMTIPELESELTRRYAGSYLQNPQVTVFVKEFSSQRITLEGAVRQPGIRIMFITGFAAVALSAAQATPQAKVLSKPVHLRDLVNEVERMIAA